MTGSPVDCDYLNIGHLGLEHEGNFVSQKMSRRVLLCHHNDLSSSGIRPEHGESTLAPLHRHQHGLAGGGHQTTSQPVGAARAQLAWGLPPLLRQIRYRGEPLGAEGDRGPCSCCSALQDSGTQPGPGSHLCDGGGSGGGALSGAGPDHGGGRGAEGRRHCVQTAQHSIR